MASLPPGEAPARAAVAYLRRFTIGRVYFRAPGHTIRLMPPEDYSEFVNAGVPSMFFRIGVYEPQRVAAAGEGGGSQ